MNKINIGPKIYNVVNENDFLNNPTNYKPGDVAVHVGNQVLPYMGAYGTYTGFYYNGMVTYGVMSDNQERYDAGKIIDFDNSEGMKELIAANNNLKKIERNLLSNYSGTIYTPQSSETASPEMVGLRQAITEKHIDIKAYEKRFGKSFDNDLRLINKHDTITFPKLRSIMDKLDIKGTLILEDAGPDVPNPIGKQIVIDISHRGGIDDDGSEESNN